MPGAGVQIVGYRVGGSEVSGARLRERGVELIEHLLLVGGGCFGVRSVVGRARTARQRRPQRVAPKARLSQ